MPVEYLHDEIHKKILEYDVVGIDEGHFFKGIGKFANELADSGKIVIITTLGCDFLKRPFEETSDLFAIAEKVVKLTAVCEDCHEEAYYVFRKGDSKEQRIIGGKELHIPLCRRCYNSRKGIEQNRNL